jgi:inner membrane protein
MTTESMGEHPANSSQESSPRLPRQPWHRRLGLGAAGFEATRRAFFLGVLTLILLIPLGMIGDLVQERESRRSGVEAEITGQWGGPQIVLGPILAVPYRYVTEATAAATQHTSVAYLFFLPKTLDIDATAKAERRAKSIYQVLVYGGSAKLTGSFVDVTKPRPDVPPETIDWSGARLLVGLSDLTALRNLTVSVGRQAPVAADALEQESLLSSSVAAPIPLSAADLQRPIDFTVNMDFRGSSALNFTPVGDETRITLDADWPHPDFSGRSLPDDRAITDQGFSAHWSVGSVARAFPASWRVGEVNPENLWTTGVGVAFVEPGDVHQQTDRILKYGVLVIGLTFATIFINGLIAKGPAGRHVHPVQYLMVGAALCLFYLLLLSLAEQIGFAPAYVVASAADIALVAWYAWRTMSRGLGYATAMLLAALQTYMYMLLQMEDYALLSGTVALFLALLAAMVATRNTDWYRIGEGRAA